MHVDKADFPGVLSRTVEALERGEGTLSIASTGPDGMRRRARRVGQWCVSTVTAVPVSTIELLSRELKMRRLGARRQDGLWKPAAIGLLGERD